MLIACFGISIVIFVLILLASILVFYTDPPKEWSRKEIFEYFNPIKTFTIILLIIFGLSTVYFYRQIEIAKASDPILTVETFIESGKISSLGSFSSIYCDRKLKITKTTSYIKGLGDSSTSVVIEVLED